MSKSLIIPDIHNKVDVVDKLLLITNWDKVFFLGDYFDDFGDNKHIAAKTANWLKENLKNEKFHFIFGNHDIGYRFPGLWWTSCSGFSNDKSEIINAILTVEDWNKLKLFYFEQGFYLSHAGMNKDIFKDNAGKILIENVTEKCEQALASPDMNEVIGAGQARGGFQKIGGITWLDFRVEFQEIEGICQIVGHTRHKEPSAIIGANSKNYCLDTNMNHYGILENGELKTKRIDWTF